MSAAIKAPRLETWTGNVEAMLGADNYRDWLVQTTLPHLRGRVLEVGAGIGYMTESVAARHEVVALELREDHVQVLAQRLADVPQVQVVLGDVTDSGLVRRLAEPPFGSAMSFNVFEHIEDDLVAFQNVCAALEPGGRFVCFVPAFPALYGKHDAAIGHVRRYVREELRRKSEQAGFAVVELRHMNLPGFFAWFLNGKVFRSSGFAGGGRALRAYDKTIIPLTRFLESRWRAPFGQSLLLVAQRRR